MTGFNRSTRRRLQQLRQVPSVWEGDRRKLAPRLMHPDSDTPRQGDCILWVDGTEGMVRAMDVVSSDAGHEAIVRTLLQAMEYPHNNSGLPARPQKILVRDRELQFFLRGVLQELNIVVDYAPALPLIDEIFQGLQGLDASHPPELPAEYAIAILQTTRQIWQISPWTNLDEEKIIAVELNFGDIETLYISTLGMLGMEYGLLMYRSLESLKKFRQQVLAANDTPQALEEAFLEQDCLFVTFDQLEDAPELVEPESEDEQEAILNAFRTETGVQPSFGNLHPLEGMRPVLYAEEARVLLVALQALQRFFQSHLSEMSVDEFPAITSRYRIPNPDQPSQKLSIKVATLPEVAEELYELSMQAELEGDAGFPNLPILHNDLIPEDAFYSLGAMPWETLDILRQIVQSHQAAGKKDVGRSADGFPVILIQTSRPKAKALIEGIQAAGGLQAICFNSGEDPLSAAQYDLGLLQTNNGELHLFGEFSNDDPVHIQARKKWDQRCKKTKGSCGLVIARGLKGASRGNPQLSDMMALFEAKAISENELGLGALQLIPYLE